VNSGVLPVWWDPATDGPANMAADELLAEEAEEAPVGERGELSPLVPAPPDATLARASRPCLLPSLLA
jgi:hypothetical protein